MGKASELAGFSTSQFQTHLGARNFGARYELEDALEDKAILAAARQS